MRKLALNDEILLSIQQPARYIGGEVNMVIKDPEKVYSREHLYEQVWKGGYYGEDNTVNVHISNLRRKIAAADPEDEYIRTVWGIGFKMA